MLPDGNGLALLDPIRLKAGWADAVGRIGRTYGFDPDQEAKARKLLADSSTWADYWFNNPDNDEQRRKYYHDLAQVQAAERDPAAMEFELERAWESRRAVDTDRKTLTAPLSARSVELAESVAALATPEQKQRAGLWKATMHSITSLRAPSAEEKEKAGAYTPPWTFLDVANSLTIYGLIAMGVCLIWGFLTPFAALCAAGFLAMIYLSMPPWPGLPPNPKAEGHYWIVSKNLVELIACLAIATTASGHWFGIDRLVFGARRRRRWARWEQRQAARTSEHDADSNNSIKYSDEPRPTVRVSTRP